ncbi:MAG TPA: OmpA family protein [Gemmatimonadaceae bacterium]|jgi:peptidoglycan-associated lipoprotein|nr:OmpA family protein [Gemmatimonadaceae bacterium]
MAKHRLFAAALAALVVAVPVAAQKGGTVEVGGFGQYTIVDDAWHVQNGWGGGGRLGVFLASHWELEATAAFSSFTNEAPRAGGSSSNQTFNGQINFNLPFGMGGRTHHFLLEAGAGAQRFASHTDFSVPLGAGFRFALNDVLALRFDGIVEYVENPTAATFGFPPVIGVNSQAARSTNVELRAGLSFMLGNRTPAPPPVVAQTRPTPPPPRQEPPQQPPARIDTTRPPPRVNTDSINAVNRAREALLAKLYFDFDRSELREDQRSVLDEKLPVLRANPGVRIRVEGNADERGSDEYNIALGMRRAQTARKYLIDHGIDAARIEISSNGEERPVCQEHDESCWKQNRRDEFVIIAGGDRLVAPR